ncbi:MAG: hypothetical protein LAO06_21540 [Acidobacteriia bacterium]|nr:hypothetical protein [Terriglobia bacterium]
MGKTKLIYAVEMLHYLPLFIAHERELRDVLDIELAPPPYGDQSAIRSLTSTATKDEDIHFCVCDPMMVSLRSAHAAVGADEPLAIAQLVGKVPFWAVNHSEPVFNTENDFERFNQIFAYPAPNTGHIFGKLVYSRFETARGGSLNFREKPIGADLDLYLNGAAQTVVIEADMLKIRKFTEATGNQIVYSFARNRNYKHFCFTAVLTHRAWFSTDKGRDEARSLVSALVRATDLIYTYPDLAKTYALSRFRKDYTDDIIDGALDALCKDGIFSRSPVIELAGWHKSGQLRRKMESGFAFPSSRRYVDNRVARKEFTAHVKHKAADGEYVITNLSALTSPLRGVAVTTLGFVALYLLPFFFSVVRQHFRSALSSNSMFEHALSTTGVLLLYVFGARIFHSFELDPAKWLEWRYSMFLPYALEEVKIVTKIVEELSRQ